MCIGEDHSETGLLTYVYWGGLFTDKSTDVGIGTAYSQTGLLT